MGAEAVFSELVSTENREFLCSRGKTLTGAPGFDCMLQGDPKSQLRHDCDVVEVAWQVGAMAGTRVAKTSTVTASLSILLPSRPPEAPQGCVLRLPLPLPLLFVFFMAWSLWTTSTIAGCSRDKGYSGGVPQLDEFLNEHGTISQGEGVIFATSPLPPDTPSLEVVLETHSGGADLSVGLDTKALDYFSNGPGPGLKKIRVTPRSRVPMAGGVWYVQVSCPFEKQAEFSVTARRGAAGPSGAGILLDTSGTLAQHTEAYYTLEVPEEAEYIEVDLSTSRGDADLFVGADQEQENYLAANPGTGDDIVIVTPRSYAPLTAGTWHVRVEAWSDESEYRLTARTQ